MPPAKTSPGPWNAFADVDVLVDAVLAERAVMAENGTRPMRSGPKPRLAGARPRKARMAIWCIRFCGMQRRGIGPLSDIPAARFADARRDTEIADTMLRQLETRSATEGKMDKPAIIPILKPCPFCGDRAQIVHSGTFRVECPDCGAIGPPAPTSERAVVRWNRRGSGASDDFG